MLTIIHGDDTAASRRYFIDLKKKDPESTLLDGESVSLTDLIQALQGNDLFALRKTIFIEQLLSKRKQSRELDSIKDYLKKHTQDVSIYVWEGKAVDKKTLSQFSSAVVKNFSFPQQLFVFLDSLKPNNGRVSTVLFHQVLETTDCEMVFFLLIRQLRLLIAMHGQDTQIEETKRLAPWQKTKLLRQAQLFSLERLKQLYATLYELDYAQKTGSLQLPLASAIDFLLLEI